MEGVPWCVYWKEKDATQTENQLHNTANIHTRRFNNLPPPPPPPPPRANNIQFHIHDQTLSSSGARAHNKTEKT